MRPGQFDCRLGGSPRNTTSPTPITHEELRRRFAAQFEPHGSGWLNDEDFTVHFERWLAAGQPADYDATEVGRRSDPTPLSYDDKQTAHVKQLQRLLERLMESGGAW